LGGILFAAMVDDSYQLIIITTDHWSESWFRQLVLPCSRYNDLPEDRLTFFDMLPGTFDEKFERLLAVLHKFQGKSRVFACTDTAMELYSAALAELQHKKPCDFPDLDQLTGANFVCYQLATNKLACRKLVAGCGSMKAEPVMSDDVNLPDLGVEGFFKPLAECGSKGVFRVDQGASVPNPLKGTLNPISKVPDKVQQLLSQVKELEPYNDHKLVGLVEQYADPNKRRTVSIDGWVHDGKVRHYSISENIYLKDAPEKFDYLVTPAPGIPPATEKNLWDLYDTVAKDMICRGLNNQFFDVEAFIFPDGDVAVMEVNCRTFSNQLPLFGHIFGYDMFSGAIDLLKNTTPAIDSDTLYGTPSPNGKIGVCTYYDELIPGAPEVEMKTFHFGDKTEGTAWYYSAGPAYPAHVYAVCSENSGDPTRARALCDTFYAEFTRKYATKGSRCEPSVKKQRVIASQSSIDVCKK